MGARLKVAVLFGGRSGEHEVSLRSAVSVVEGLAVHHDVLCILVDRAGRWRLQPGGRPQPHGGEEVFLVPSPADAGRLRRLRDATEAARPDVFFPVLHGPHGEDGTVQGLLELAAAPYVGSGVAASAVSMDKGVMKALFAWAGLPQVEHQILRERTPGGEEARVVEELGLPVFVKPACLGSSVAVSKVKQRADLGAALDKAFAFDLAVVVEKGVEAREVEVAVLGNDEPEVSQPGEIVPDREFYDYDSKYSDKSRTELLIPAPLDQTTTDQVRRLGVEAFRAVGASGLARVDFFVERGSGRVLVNEINTMPGFTSISMYPRLWESSGVPYPELLARLVVLAGERHARRARLRIDYGS